jgi:hypothetical protein
LEGAAFLLAADTQALEHIADRDSYALARELVLKLVPGEDCAKRVVG